MKILLLCSAGMSTSLLVQRMKEVAEKRKLDAIIWNCSFAHSEQEIDKADVILIGPQLRYLRPKIEALADGKPICVIDMMTYGRMDGANAVNMALKAWEE